MTDQLYHLLMVSRALGFIEATVKYDDTKIKPVELEALRIKLAALTEDFTRDHIERSAFDFGRSMRELEDAQ